MKAIVSILLLEMTGAVLADTAKPMTGDKAGQSYIYDANRKPYIDDRLRSHRLQEEAPPALDNSGRIEKKDRALGTD
jgi:hypothetical protein